MKLACMALLVKLVISPFWLKKQRVTSHLHLKLTPRAWSREHSIFINPILEQKEKEPKILIRFN